jgi:hypothetical protein
VLGWPLEVVLMYCSHLLAHSCLLLKLTGGTAPS